jgi:hypothetical protein
MEPALFHHRNETIISYLSYFFTPFVILAGLRFHSFETLLQAGKKEAKRKMFLGREK